MRQRLLTYGLWLVLGLPSLSYADTEQWITDPRGCTVSNIAPQEGETITWSGECKNGFAHGEGTLTWFEKGVKVETYIGTMVNGYAE